MKVKCFTKNSVGKIEFTEDQLKELLDDVYQDGYNDGSCQNSHTWWWYPGWVSNYKDYGTYSTYFSSNSSTELDSSSSNITLSNNSPNVR